MKPVKFHKDDAAALLIINVLFLGALLFVLLMAAFL